MQLNFETFNTIVDILQLEDEEKQKLKDSINEMATFNKFIMEKLKLEKPVIDSLIQLQVGMRMKQKFIDYEKEISENFSDENQAVAFIVADSLSDFAKEHQYPTYDKLYESSYHIIEFVTSRDLI